MLYTAETSVVNSLSMSKMLKEICLVAASTLTCVRRKGPLNHVGNSCPLHSDGSISSKSNTKRMAREVFLGGSCNPTTWRTDIAIPALNRLGITYYNPQVSNWCPDLVAKEHEAKRTARILFFVIDDRTRNCAGIIEAANLAATRNDSLIIVIHPYRSGQKILGEKISKSECRELTNALCVLKCLMDKERIPVFGNILAALSCVSKVIRDSVSLHELHEEDGVKQIRTSFSQQGTDITKLREIFKSVDKNDIGTISVNEALTALKTYTKSNSQNLDSQMHNESDRLLDQLCFDRDQREQFINFDRFCSLASEWSWRMKNKEFNSEKWTFTLGCEKRDLYIGVEETDTTLLESTLIPFCESKGLSLYHPGVDEFSNKIMSLELQKMNNSRFILLVIPENSRGIVLMTIAGYLIGLKPKKLILCINQMSEHTDESSNFSEKMTEQALKDYNRGRMYLLDMATRESVPVFQNHLDALQYAMQLFQRP